MDAPEGTVIITDALPAASGRARPSMPLKKAEKPESINSRITSVVVLPEPLPEVKKGSFINAWKEKRNAAASKKSPREAEPVDGKSADVPIAADTTLSERRKAEEFRECVIVAPHLPEDISPGPEEESSQEDAEHVAVKSTPRPEEAGAPQKTSRHPEEILNDTVLTMPFPIEEERPVKGPTKEAATVTGKARMTKAKTAKAFTPFRAVPESFNETRIVFQDAAGPATHKRHVKAEAATSSLHLSARLADIIKTDPLRRKEYGRVEQEGVPTTIVFPCEREAEANAFTKTAQKKAIGSSGNRFFNRPMRISSRLLRKRKGDEFTAPSPEEDAAVAAGYPPMPSRMEIGTLPDAPRKRPPLPEGWKSAGLNRKWEHILGSRRRTEEFVETVISIERAPEVGGARRQPPATPAPRVKEAEKKSVSEPKAETPESRIVSVVEEGEKAASPAPDAGLKAKKGISFFRMWIASGFSRQKIKKAEPRPDAIHAGLEDCAFSGPVVPEFLVFDIALEEAMPRPDIARSPKSIFIKKRNGESARTRRNRMEPFADTHILPAEEEKSRSRVMAGTKRVSDPAKAAVSRKITEEFRETFIECPSETAETAPRRGSPYKCSPALPAQEKSVTRTVEKEPSPRRDEKAFGELVLTLPFPAVEEKKNTVDLASALRMRQSRPEPFDDIALPRREDEPFAESLLCYRLPKEAPMEDDFCCPGIRFRMEKLMTEQAPPDRSKLESRSEALTESLIVSPAYEQEEDFRQPAVLFPSWLTELFPGERSVRPWMDPYGMLIEAGDSLDTSPAAKGRRHRKEIFKPLEFKPYTPLVHSSISDVAPFLACTIKKIKGGDVNVFSQSRHVQTPSAGDPAEPEPLSAFTPHNFPAKEGALVQRWDKIFTGKNCMAMLEIGPEMEVELSGESGMQFTSFEPENRQAKILLMSGRMRGRIRSGNLFVTTPTALVRLRKGYADVIISSFSTVVAPREGRHAEVFTKSARQFIPSGYYGLATADGYFVISKAPPVEKPGKRNWLAEGEKELPGKKGERTIRPEMRRNTEKRFLEDHPANLFIEPIAKKGLSPGQRSPGGTLPRRK